MSPAGAAMAERQRPALRADEILRMLTARGIDFVVIGGIAAILHGSAQTTYDLDICYATDRGNLEALGEVLIELGARLKGVDDDIPFVPDTDTLRRVEVLTMVTEKGELDVLARPAGSPGYEVLRRNADRFDLDSFSVLVASIDDLIAMKTAAGRKKDEAAVEELEAIKRLQARGT
jgi:predicted nucleotidyltransferase